MYPLPLACPLHMQVLYFSVTYNSLPRSFQHSVLDFSLSSNTTFSSRPSLTTQAKATAISSLPYGTGLDYFLHICCDRLGLLCSWLNPPSTVYLHHGRGCAWFFSLQSPSQPGTMASGNCAERLNPAFSVHCFFMYLTSVEFDHCFRVLVINTQYPEC